MIKRKIRKTELIIFITAFLVGILIIRQSLVVANAKTTVKEENVIKLSYEIIELADSNFELQNELNRLRIKNEGFSFDIKDRARMKEDLDKKIGGYRVVNGFEEISGRGIEIRIEGGMITEEIVDLINGIRNTNPDAIGINGKRVVYRSYFIMNTDTELEVDNKKMSLPLTIQIIGDPDVLRKSLDRAGGVLDVLRKNSFDKIKFTVENKDNLSLPAYDGQLGFRYTKVLGY